MSASAPSPSTRLLSLDVFRGLVIAAMIFVTDPGIYGHQYAQLKHSAWNGATATDMIFPAFLLMVGIAIPFSFASRSRHGATTTAQFFHILRRSLILFLLGIALLLFPDNFGWHNFQTLGILQRIALCYFGSALLYLFCKRDAIIAIIAFALLALYWAFIKLVPVPGVGAGHIDPFGSLPSYVDRVVLGVNHLGHWPITPGKGVTYSENGILGTLTAIFSTLTGIITGNWLRSPRTNKTKAVGLFLCGIALAIIGLALNPFLVINKPIWTSTFALLSTGISLATFAIIYVLVDIYRLRRGLTPFLIFGTNAIFAFVLSTIITKLLRIRVAPHGLRTLEWVTHHLFASWLPLDAASLAYAFLIVAMNMALIYPLYRKRIFLKL
jgi:predicted acyltransferase